MTVTVGANFEVQLELEVGAKPVNLLDLDFSTGHRRFAGWHHDVVYAGNTYAGLGPIAHIDTPEASQATPLGEQFLRFFVQNDASLLADLQQNSRNRWCDGYLVMLVDGAPVDGEAMHLWRKRMVPGGITSSAGTYVVDLALESRFHRSRNRAPKTYSNAEQLRRDPTDFAFRDAGKQFDVSRPDWVQKSGLPKA